VLSTDTRAVATIFIANLLYTSNIVATITDDKIFDECISAKKADYSTPFHYSDITAIAAAMTPRRRTNGGKTLKSLDKNIRERDSSSLLSCVSRMMKRRGVQDQTRKGARTSR